MNMPYPVPRLIEEWLRWAAWTTDPKNEGKSNPDLVGHSEFDWAVQDHPEHAWQAILGAMENPAAKPYLGVLAAGPLEDLLSRHGPAFIERVETEARSSPDFAWMLGGVWKHTMPEEIWLRVQVVWDRRGWDGIPKDGV